VRGVNRLGSLVSNVAEASFLSKTAKSAQFQLSSPVVRSFSPGVLPQKSWFSSDVEPISECYGGVSLFIDLEEALLRRTGLYNVEQKVYVGLIGS
jgi:hypothetical protein